MRSNCGHRKLVIALLGVCLALTVSATNDHAAIGDSCEFEIEFIKILLDRCIEIKFGARFGDCLGSIGPFEMYICNDRNYTFMIHIDKLSPEVIFSLSYCKPYCIITTNVSNTCHFYNFTKTDNNLKDHQKDFCIDESNSNDCLPTIGMKASCRPHIELIIITKDGKHELYSPHKLINNTCPRYRDPVSPNSIGPGSKLIQLCNYNILEPTEDSSNSISPIIMNLFAQASAECLEFLKKCKRNTLTEVASVTSILDPQSQECLKNDSDLPVSCNSSEQKGTPSRRTNVSVGFSEGLILLTNCSSVNVSVCMNNSNPELRNIDPLRLQLSSKDTGIVIKPNTLDISVMSNPMKCASVTVAVTIDTCDQVRNVTIVVESVKDSENLEYLIVYNNNHLTFQIKSSDTSNNNATIAAAAVITTIVIIFLLAILIGAVIKLVIHCRRST